MPDNAQFLETKLRDYIEGACRLAKAMRKAQGVAVERSPKNAGRSAAEKAQHASERTQTVLLDELDAILVAVGQAVGMSEAAMLTAVNRRRQELEGGAF